MFQNRRQASLGNINLGKLSAAPSQQDMAFLMEQALRYKGRFVEISWAIPKTGATFQLTAKLSMGQALPTWMLYRTTGGASDLVWGHNSNDLTLMHNLILLECEKPVEGNSNAISAGAMDSMMSNNMHAGSMAGNANDPPPMPAGHSLQPHGTPAGANPANPAAAWLQNLASTHEYASPTNQSSSGEYQARQPAMQAQPTSAQAVQQQVEPMMEQLTELSMEGSLSNISVPNLLQYLVNNNSSGRLALQSSFGTGEVFLRTGAFLHAATLDTKGDTALLDMATWRDGEFNFHPDDQSAQNTVKTESKALLATCHRTAEHSRLLESSGVFSAPYLVPAQEDVQRPQLERLVAQIGLADADQTWRAYRTIDGSGSVYDLVRKCPMPRIECINVLFTLMQCKLIQTSEQPWVNKRDSYLEPLPIDEHAIAQFMQSNVGERDGFLNAGAFLYLLQQEFYRYERTGARFALAVFSLAKSNLLNGDVHQLDGTALQEATRRINDAKRKLDVIGHFDSDYALLLPETDSAGAAVFANRIAHLLKKTPISPEISDHDQLVLSFGIAAIPDDVRDLGTLLAAVKVAKNKSKMMGAPIILYSNAI